MGRARWRDILGLAFEVHPYQYTIFLLCKRKGLKWIQGVVYPDTGYLRLLQTDAYVKAARLSLSVSPGEEEQEEDVLGGPVSTSGLLC